MNSTETILREKLLNFSSYLKEKCNNPDHVKQIDEKLNNLKFYEIMAFILFLDENKLDSYINDLYSLYNSLEDSQEVRDNIKENLNYFLKIKNIFKNPLENNF
uniref:Uncharacterized protein n=1 Tax=viral metagenome TaxID=1070528 RepID=A0A6C0EDE1_9ZZZZ